MKKKRDGTFIVLLTCILAVPTVACLLNELSWNFEPKAWAPWLVVGVILGLIHIILRPILRLITLPLGCLTFGLSGTVIDVALIYFSGSFVRGFEMPGLLYAVLTALVVNVVSAVAGRK